MTRSVLSHGPDPWYGVRFCKKRYLSLSTSLKDIFPGGSLQDLCSWIPTLRRLKGSKVIAQAQSVKGHSAGNDESLLMFRVIPFI